ncbi:hypothetical protein DVW02_11750 [Clostridium botulinum]|nr:hypothetical protein [Clostridium botulinum]
MTKVNIPPMSVKSIISYIFLYQFYKKIYLSIGAENKSFNITAPNKFNIFYYLKYQDYLNQIYIL